MFAVLWGWEGDGRQRELVQRTHWNTKPYRELFRPQEWRELVYATFVRTHWVLPNPTERDFWPKGIGNRLPLWCTTHLTLLQYLRRDIIGHTIGRQVEYRWTQADLPTLPRVGWERSEAAFTTTLPLGYRVELILPSLPTGLISDDSLRRKLAAEDRALSYALSTDGF
ncbi:hypothetical protein N7523_006538 [Penicillium sp. IBT 18751x]|nr:hypothetical protein N7523_006538 [Penicillium sp. IBT 18751x]